MFSWNKVLQKMDYKSVVYNAARDGNLNRLKVSAYLLSVSQKDNVLCIIRYCFFLEHCSDIDFKNLLFTDAKLVLGQPSKMNISEIEIIMCFHIFPAKSYCRSP